MKTKDRQEMFSLHKSFKNQPLSFILLAKFFWEESIEGPDFWDSMQSDVHERGI